VWRCNGGISEIKKKRFFVLYFAQFALPFTFGEGRLQLGNENKS
jgi:hypothetical protein